MRNYSLPTKAMLQPLPAMPLTQPVLGWRVLEHKHGTWEGIAPRASIATVCFGQAMLQFAQMHLRGRTPKMSVCEVEKPAALQDVFGWGDLIDPATLSTLTLERAITMLEDRIGYRSGWAVEAVNV